MTNNFLAQFSASSNWGETKCVEEEKPHRNLPPTPILYVVTEDPHCVLMLTREGRKTTYGTRSGGGVAQSHIERGRVLSVICGSAFLTLKTETELTKSAILIKSLVVCAA